MRISPREAFAIIWIGWVASWMLAAFWSGRTESRAVELEVGAYRLALSSGAVLLTPWAARAAGAQPLWEPGYAGAYLLAGITLAGLALTWWARIYLGRLWSSAITRKQGHRIVDTGPYALVRHPIYAGLIVAIIATTIAEATATALAGAVLIVVGFWIKARAEERFLAAELGAEAYAAYRRRVGMLLPLPRRQRRR